MAKSINWPAEFQETVLNEGTETIYCALRPGSLYFENRYWVEDEVIDIRVNQQLVRKGVIVGDLKCLPIQDISQDDLLKHKPCLQDKPAILSHLQSRYGQDLTEQSLVTLVYYKNLPIESEDSTKNHVEAAI